MNNENKEQPLFLRAPVFKKLLQERRGQKRRYPIYTERQTDRENISLREAVELFTHSSSA